MALPELTPRRPLGRTGFVATRVGVGDLADRTQPLATCVATLIRALDAGLNVVDTAPNYEDGYSEEIVGRALAGRRDGVFLVDKIDVLDQPVGPQVDGSLGRLGLDHVDLFAFHNVTTADGWHDVARYRLDELDRCRQAGKVRFRGISSHDPDVLHAALDDGRVDIVMFPVGPYVDRRYFDEILPRAREAGVGTISFKTFGAGKLLGDTEGYNVPLRPRGKIGSGGGTAPTPTLPVLTVDECVRYTLTLDPDVALLGMSAPNEQDAALAAVAAFTPMTAAELEDVRQRAERAIAGKGAVWWNPTRI